MRHIYGDTYRRKLMPQLKLMLPMDLPDHPDESRLDTIPFILGGADCLLSVMEVAGAMELSIALGVVTGPLAAAVGSFMALGAGYDEAKADITWDELSRGFSLGAVMGASGVSPKKAVAYFGHRFFARNAFLEGGAQIAADAYKKGLMNGYSQGRSLSQEQRQMLAIDLRSHARTLPGWFDFKNETSESAKQWSDRTWIEYYLFFGGVFRKFHLSDD
jgi:hypothetical protein